MRLQRQIDQVRAGVDRLHAVADSEATATDAAGLMQAAGMEPDPWQRRTLAGPHSRTLQLVTRQGGKSTSAAAKALSTALTQPGSLSLLLSPSLRQSQELFEKVTGLYFAAGEPVALDKLSALRARFVHGSRIVALPGTEKTVRGYSGVDLLVIDEAARVLDELYYAVRPMLAVSGGELLAMTTPWGKRGWFYEAWTSDEAWQRIKVTAHECPRIAPEFLEEERRTMPDAWFQSEYFCRFADTVDSVFASGDIDRAFQRGRGVPSLFAGEASAPGTKPLIQIREVA